MPQSRTLLFCLLCVAIGIISVNAQGMSAGKLQLSPYNLRTYDGKEHPAELGRLSVQENRNAKTGRFIQLAFVRLKSTSAQPDSPIVFLAGGPGIPGIGLAQVPVYYSLFEQLRAVSDVILLDQRGTGLSSPNLQCPPAEFPADVFETTDNFLRAYSQFVSKCASHWRAEKVDLSAYNSNESADDLEDLRSALGAERLNLLAWSYGTELALTTIRRHGQRLNRVVLAGTRGPDNLLKLPSVWDAHVKRISQLVGEDTSINQLVPDMEALMRQVLDRLERNPVTIEINSQRGNSAMKMNVGKIGLQTLIRGELSNARNFASLPALLFTVNQGEHSILTRRIERLFNGFGSSAMSLATDCAAGWSSKRLARTNEEAKRALMSNVNLQWRPDICKLTGSSDLGRQFRSRIGSKIETLFLSGTLDPNTPPSEAEEVRRGFSRSAHLIVENAGHEFLPAAEVQTVILDFFKGHDVSRRKISLPRPRFTSVDEAKLPPLAVR